MEAQEKESNSAGPGNPARLANYFAIVGIDPLLRSVESLSDSKQKFIQE